MKFETAEKSVRAEAAKHAARLLAVGRPFGTLEWKAAWSFVQSLSHDRIKGSGTEAHYARRSERIALFEEYVRVVKEAGVSTVED